MDEEHDDPELARKLDLLNKYVKGLEGIWKRMIDEGPETGDPLGLFDGAIELTERSLASLLGSEPTTLN